MRKVVITRIETGPEGTFGQLMADSGYYCLTGELPSRDNLQGKSCIPAGIYNCNRRLSEKHKANVYHVDGVKDRTDIEIHPANMMGNTDLGYVSELLGCIALGKSVVVFLGGAKPAGEKNQRGVSASKDALAAFEKDLNGEDFELEIKGVP